MSLMDMNCGHPICVIVKKYRKFLIYNIYDQFKKIN